MNAYTMNTRKQQRSLFYAVDVLKRMEDAEEKKKNSANNGGFRIWLEVLPEHPNKHNLYF